MSRARMPQEMTEECVPNIGLRGRRRRRNGGLIALALAAAFAAWALSRGIEWWGWALLAVLYGYGILGLLQAHEKT